MFNSLDLLKHLIISYIVLNLMVLQHKSAKRFLLLVMVMEKRIKTVAKIKLGLCQGNNCGLVLVKC